MKLWLAIATGLVWLPAWGANCPFKSQNIKVIDLKSGWWQGDGIDTDRYVIRLIEGQCPQVNFYYEHTLYGMVGAPVAPQPSGPIKFHQVWLLSGGEADGADLRLNDPTFQAYQKLMVDSDSNLFIGTGFGNIYHANSVTSELGLGQLFITDRQVHEYPSPHTLAVVNEIPVTVHSLFEGFTTLPHIINVGGFEAPSDWLAADPRVVPLASDSGGKTVIGLVQMSQRRVVMDANLARTYLVREGESRIQNYLLNLVRVLEQ